MPGPRWTCSPSGSRRRRSTSTPRSRPSRSDRDRRHVRALTDYDTARRPWSTGATRPTWPRSPSRASCSVTPVKASRSHWTDQPRAARGRPSEPYIDLAGSFDDTLYGVFYKGDVKSIVWYPVQAFEEDGYAIPTTWDELIALSDQIVADGNGNPGASRGARRRNRLGGAPTGSRTCCCARRRRRSTTMDRARDPVQRPRGPRGRRTDLPDLVHARLRHRRQRRDARHHIEVVQDPMFNEDGPACWMQKQAAWIPGFWPEGTVAAGRTAPSSTSRRSMTSSAARCSAPATSSSCSTIGPRYVPCSSSWPPPRVARGGSSHRRLSVAQQVGPGRLVHDLPDEWAGRLVAEASTFGFDASDLMPAEVGTGTFWTGMLDWISADGENTGDLPGDRGQLALGLAGCSGREPSGSLPAHSEGIDDGRRRRRPS